jgi:spore maturation protein CgeB
VSQSDEYEDHDDRLFEALASGALVLADEMVAPPVGLKNKTNIIFFNGTDVLDSLIRFYLKHSELRQKIARHGMEYALGRHRSWHVLEKLLFGKALTRTDKAPLDAEGPAKRKHAMEKSTIVSLVM